MICIICYNYLLFYFWIFLCPFRAFVFCRFQFEIKVDFCIEQFSSNVNLALKFCSEYLLDLVFPFQFNLAILKAILIPPPCKFIFNIFSLYAKTKISWVTVKNGSLKNWILRTTLYDTFDPDVFWLLKVGPFVMVTISTKPCLFYVLWFKKFHLHGQESHKLELYFVWEQRLHHITLGGSDSEEFLKIKQTHLQLPDFLRIYS